ncbi:spore germination protein, amino acid permease [Desulfosporosinus orientis DSM 765]|uniref:Spore germination protein, amino acid permease n=1 Tax=Desulfosporosinus orientis (strain ATCC 19365 / DSM 765 / NCIMB 8382 / VKM B-1628 / Singapore I) TaxID=768706 RepID=G7W8F6_DESOD|nr:endospore germination permease [Desulfosporosinus orientis]AET67096.1 spore germination protein, amino acid permease [Desulfosporosinus orientis DSM 765]
MKLEKGEISSSQLMFLVGCFIQGSLLSSLSYAYPIAKHDTWLAVIAALILGLLFAFIYLAIANQFPGQNIIQINDLVFGPYLGKFVSLHYVYLFLSSLSIYLWYIGDFVLTYVMPETPVILIMIMFIFICAWAVRLGIEVIARVSILFFFITYLIITVTVGLLLKDMKFTNLLPIFELPLRDFIHSTHIILHYSFSTVMIFLMVIPSMNKPKEAKKSVLLGMIFGGMFMIMGAVRDIATLGPLCGVMTTPSLEAVRIISIAKILTRLEVLVAMGQIFLLFIIASLFYYTSAVSIAQLTKLRTYVPLVFPLGIISVTQALTSYESRMQLSYMSIHITPMYSLLFYLVIPLTTLIVAKLRHLPK